MRNNENGNGAIQFSSASPSNIGIRPFALFIKASLTIFFCEAIILALIQLLPVSDNDKWEFVLSPPLLTVLASVFLYKLVVKPMSDILKTSEKVKNKLELFKLLIDKSNDNIFIIDPQTAGFLDVNYMACIQFGYTKEEFQNMTVMDIEKVIPDISVWAECVEKIKSSRYAILQGRYKRKNGTTFPVEVTKSIVSWNKRDYIVAIARDVSEREFAASRIRDSETKFRKIAECAKDAIIMMGPKGEISFWNRAAGEMFGYSSDEAIGKNLHSLLAPKRFQDAFMKGLAGFQKTGQGNAMGKTLKLSAVRKSGIEFDIELSVAPVRIDDKWHAVGIVRDLSERKETEADLSNQDKAVEITAQSKAE
jgi:PAS domain S-box-containing protein